MGESRFSEEQIIGILKKVEAGGTVAQVTREHGIFAGTFCRWRAK